jgi:Replication stress response SDE2 C-terminal/SPRY domain
VANWHLALPAWSEVSAKREVQRNQRLLSRHVREQRERQQQRDEVQRRQEQQVAHYVDAVEQATQSVQASVAAAILAAAQSSRKPEDATAITAIARQNHDDRSSSAATTLHPELLQPPSPPPTKRFKTAERSVEEVESDPITPPPPPLAVVTLSGDANLDRIHENDSIWRLTGQSNFCTVGILLDPHKITVAAAAAAKSVASGSCLYWEVVLVDNDEAMTTTTATATATATTGSTVEKKLSNNDNSTDQSTLAVVQVGWAFLSSFRPDSEAGDGVGDVPYSWAYDTSRALALQNGNETVNSDNDDELPLRERPYGTRPCSAGDVIGCCWDVYGTGQMSFAVNGQDLGVAFTVPMDKTMRSKSKGDSLIGAAVSCNAGLSVDLKWHARDFQYSPVGSMVVVPVGDVMMNDESAVDWPGLSPIPESKSARLDSSRVPSHAVSSESPLGTATTASSVQKPVANDDHGGIPPPMDHTHDVLPILNWQECESVEALVALGLDRLKSALQAAGLKCGGTLHERATRLWTIRGLSPNEYPTKLLAKK